MTMIPMMVANDHINNTIVFDPTKVDFILEAEEDLLYLYFEKSCPEYIRQKDFAAFVEQFLPYGLPVAATTPTGKTVVVMFNKIMKITDDVKYRTITFASNSHQLQIVDTIEDFCTRSMGEDDSDGTENEEVGNRQE